LIENAADALPGEEVDPVHVLVKAQGMLLDAFRKHEGRDPLPEDAVYWEAWTALLKDLDREMDRQGV
jgi:hypothetical protein